MADDAQDAWLPSVHSTLWALVREPTIKVAISAQTAILMDLMRAS